jgi:hypothetical protein
MKAPPALAKIIFTIWFARFGVYSDSGTHPQGVPEKKRNQTIQIIRMVTPMRISVCQFRECHRDRVDTILGLMSRELRRLSVIESNVPSTNKFRLETFKVSFMITDRLDWRLQFTTLPKIRRTGLMVRWLHKEGFMFLVITQENPWKIFPVIALENAFFSLCGYRLADE